MSLLHLKTIGAASVLGVLMLAGCGGGASPQPDNNGPFSFDRALDRRDFFDADNNRYYDIYITEPSSSGTAQVEMRSLDVDAQLYIYRRASDGGYDLIADDDDSGDGPDALVEFEVRRGDVYRVLATSSRAEEVGYYRIIFSRELGRPGVVLPRQNARAAQDVKLPAMPAKGEPEKRAQ